MLGILRDIDSEGQPPELADDSNIDGTDDEDGVGIGALTTSGSTPVYVTVSQAGRLLTIPSP